MCQTDFQTYHELTIFSHIFQKCVGMQVATFFGLQVATSLFPACLHSNVIFHDYVMFTIVIEFEVFLLHFSHIFVYFLHF